MNKNYLIIGLIILALVVIGVIASRPGEEVTFDNAVNGNRTSQKADEPSIQVSAQTLNEGQIVIDRVVSKVDGWIVIHRANEEGETDTTSNLGYARVTAGNNSGVIVNLDEGVKDGDMLVAMLYEDTGSLGELEVDSEDAEIDAPVLVNGEVVSAPFTVVLADEPETTDNTGTTEEPESSEETAE